MTTPVKEKHFLADETLKLPRPFILRRLHSLLGVWLVIYLCEHLLVNSQAAFFFEDDAYGFVSMVNKIHDLPYLKVIELVFLGVPFAIHGLWGIKYALTARLNARQTDGSEPSLPQYKKNVAYSWQRITSWLLLVGILAHVIHMRFLEYPEKSTQDGIHQYNVRVQYDAGLPHVAEKLHVKLYDRSETKPLKKGQLLAVAPSAGAAFFLILRETFENPMMVLLYTLLVIAASFHAFNGLWTFMITWGITLTRRSQKVMRKITTTLMWLVTLLGLIAVWGTYWTTLFHK